MAVSLKRVYITGACGFLGRAFRVELGFRDIRVDGCDLLAPLYDRILPADATSLFGRGVPGDREYDLVIHLAYHVGGRAGIDGNKAALAKNLMLDAALFDWSVRTGTRVLYISSSAVYPVYLQGKTYHDLCVDDGFECRLNEESDMAEGEEELLPDGDYGWAKLTGERLARNAQAQGVPVHICRPFSGFGADQDASQYPFPAFVARAKAKQDPFEVWGDPESKRDWIHVTDLVGAALAIVEADYQEPVNLCTGIGTSFADLARMCMAAAGYEAPIQANESAPMGVFARVGDPTRMLQFYQPQVSIQQGVEEAIRGD